MADEKQIKRALNVYETLCTALDNINFKYQKHPEDLVITSSITGDDLPVELIFILNADAEMVSLYSTLPFIASESQRVELAVAVAVANHGLPNGCFDYDIEKGQIRYRIATSYRGSILGEEIFISMLANVSNIVDEYNDKLFMIVKGMMSIDQFFDWEKSKRN